jgi:hypothetical protein
MNDGQNSSSIVSRTRRVISAGSSSRGKRHPPLEAVRAGNDDPDVAPKGISGNPAFVQI